MFYHTEHFGTDWEEATKEGRTTRVRLPWRVETIFQGFMKIHICNSSIYEGAGQTLHV